MITQSKDIENFIRSICTIEDFMTRVGPGSPTKIERHVADSLTNSGYGLIKSDAPPPKPVEEDEEEEYEDHDWDELKRVVTAEGDDLLRFARSDDPMVRLIALWKNPEGLSPVLVDDEDEFVQETARGITDAEVE